MNFRMSRKLMWIGFCLGILVGFIGIFTDKSAFYAAGIIITLLSVFQGYIFYTCPYCKYSLMNVRGKTPEYCPECGRELNI